MSGTPSQVVDLSFLRARPVQFRILAVTLGLALAGFLYGTLATKSYRSTMMVVPASQQRSGISNLLGSQLGGLASALDGAGGADGARIAAVLQSAAVTDAVIEQLGLKARYGTRNREATRTALWTHCSVKVLPKPGLVEISCEDPDPGFARSMLLRLADRANQVFRSVSSGAASEEVRSLEKNVAGLRQQADEAAERMRQFQERHQIVDLESQARAVVSSVAALRGQRNAKRMELDYARRYAAPDEATARQLSSQLSVMDEQIRDLEESRPPPGEAGGAVPGSARSPKGVLPPALDVPRLRAEYEKLYRDRRVAEATLVFALERLEAAKANEARDVSTFQILDPPTLPERHSSPRRSLTTVLSALVGLVLATAFEWRRQAR